MFARVSPLACDLVTPVFFANSAAWRDWLASHHDASTECLVGFVKVTTGEANMTWSESVDVALCFGWIDGVRRRIDDRAYSIRFTPRKAGSIWSAVNVKKMAALRAAGEMTAAGERAFAERRDAKTAIYSYEREAGSFSDAEVAAFGRNEPAWSFFNKQAAWYRRTATHWVIGAKREATRIKRFEQLVTDSAVGRRLGHLSGDR
jgi:uncharacterized protein YdeI (YjbR/CyaY-like superfamily)